MAVGSGPWKVKEWVRGDHMTFEANADYFQGRPHLDRIIMKVIPDATVAYAALEKGDVHYIPFKGVVGGPPYQLVDRLKQSRHLEVNVYEVSSMQRLFFRNDKPPFNNLKVRQAVAHAIDRKFIIQKLLFGHGQIAHSEVAPAMKESYNPNVTQYAYDVAKANQLLDEAGLRRGADGVRFKTRIYGTPGSGRSCRRSSRSSSRPGIAADITINEWTTYYNAIRQTRTAEGLFSIFSLPTIPDPTTEAPRYHSRRSGRAASTTSSTATRASTSSSTSPRRRSTASDGRASSRSTRTSWRRTSPWSPCTCWRAWTSGTRASPASRSRSGAGPPFLLDKVWKGSSRGPSAA